MIDFEKEFEGFIGTGSGESVVSEVYNIIPSLTNQQMQTIHALNYYAKKYELTDLLEFVILYNKDFKQNKNLGFFSSMNAKNLLKAYTMEEYLKGINISGSASKDNN